MTKTYDLTKGNTKSVILRFFFPMLLTNMLQQIYTIADTMIVGKGLGDDPLAAVGNMSSLTFFIIGFSLGLTNGFSVSIAQAYGAKDGEKLRKTVASSVLLSAAITIEFTPSKTKYIPINIVNNNTLNNGLTVKYAPRHTINKEITTLSQDFSISSRLITELINL